MLSVFICKSVFEDRAHHFMRNAVFMSNPRLWFIFLAELIQFLSQFVSLIQKSIELLQFFLIHLAFFPFFPLDPTALIQ